MKLKTLLLGVLAAGISANLYSKSRRTAGSLMTDAGADTDTDNARTDALQASSGAMNSAERLRDDEALGAPAVPMAEGQDTADTDPMFGSSSQHGTGPIGTGLPDYSRGA